MPISMSLGGMIKRLRSAAGLSQKEFAEKLEIDRTYLSHLEADRREPSVQLLRKMASTLSLPVGLFLALALWTDLPEGEEVDQYRGLVEKLIELAALTQLKLELSK
jgi:transcriptional regulator with XRE-family HTH domain